MTPTQRFAEHWQSPARTMEMLLQYPEMKYMDQTTLDRWSQAKTQMVGDPANADHLLQYLALRKKIVLACQQQGV